MLRGFASTRRGVGWNVSRLERTRRSGSILYSELVDRYFTEREERERGRGCEGFRERPKGEERAESSGGPNQEVTSPDEDLDVIGVVAGPYEDPNVIAGKDRAAGINTGNRRCLRSAISQAKMGLRNDDGREKWG